MLVPAHLIDGCSFRAGIEFASIKFLIRAISTSWTLERGPCRKPSGGGSDRYSLSQKALRLISECSSTGTSFRLSQSGGSSGASDSWLETIRNRAKQAINVQFGAILGLIVSFFHLIAQTMRRRSTPRSRLRRRRIAEFELAKPRIHPAELYGGDEDYSARRSSTKSDPILSGNHDREFGPV